MRSLAAGQRTKGAQGERLTETSSPRLETMVAGELFILRIHCVLKTRNFINALQLIVRACEILLSLVQDGQLSVGTGPVWSSSAGMRIRPNALFCRSI